MHLDRAAPQLVNHRYSSGLGDRFNGQGRGLELFAAEPMPGHVDHVVDASKDSEVTVLRQQRAVAREVRPVVPVFAVLLLVVFGVVGLDEPVRVSVDGLENARPGVADSDFAALLTPFRYGPALLFEDLRKAAKHALAPPPLLLSPT